MLWTENFNEKWLPDDWSVQSKGGSLNTWYRDEDYMAAVDHDDDNQQDEWLISRTTDISGVDTEVHMVFDFYTTYWYTVEYKHCNLQVMASGDGGENWQEIWNLQRDSGLFTAWTKTQAKVTIPESLQSSKDLRFAFVYTGKGGSTLSMDNVQLYAEERDNYVSVTATAGEGGTITPAGQTLVKKGTSKTFDIAPAQGYEIVNVNVDGADLGPISYYTFQRVGVDHTISATFQKAQPSGDTVTLTTTANEGGTVAPAGQTSYAPGASVKVTFTPDTGYQLASVKVNGRTVDVTDGAYILVMDQSYAVSAAFEKIPDVPVVMFQNDFEDVVERQLPLPRLDREGAGYQQHMEAVYLLQLEERGQ
ncbi:MAG: InlB B-repeat-containing protein [Oscillospiraceae bacterium]